MLVKFNAILHVLSVLGKDFSFRKKNEGYRIGTGIGLFLSTWRNANSGLHLSCEDTTAVVSKGIPGLEEPPLEVYLFCKVGLHFPQSSQGYFESSGRSWAGNNGTRMHGCPCLHCKASLLVPIMEHLSQRTQVVYPLLPLFFPFCFPLHLAR